MAIYQRQLGIFLQIIARSFCRQHHTEKVGEYILNQHRQMITDFDENVFEFYLKRNNLLTFISRQEIPWPLALTLLS